MNYNSFIKKDYEFMIKPDMDKFMIKPSMNNFYYTEIRYKNIEDVIFHSKSVDFNQEASNIVEDTFDSPLIELSEEFQEEKEKIEELFGKVLVEFIKIKKQNKTK